MMSPSRAPPPRIISPRTTISLVASYVFDWIVLMALGGVGYILGKREPNKRPFSLTDPNISFPYTVNETVPATLATVLNTGIPLVLVLVVCLTLVPGSTVPRGTPKALVWRRKLWEWHQGWLGLGLSVAGAWFITNALKNMFGKPRPDLLSRCQPDLTDVAKYVVGGIADITGGDGARPGSLEGGQLVGAAICTNTDRDVLDDGFRSFPSGHASSSSAGLLYLTLFLFSKLGIALPFLHHAPFNPNRHGAALSAFPSRNRVVRDEEETAVEDERQHQTLRPASGVPIFSARQQSAAPPLYLLVLALTPLGLAVFIASSRWFDFRHHGIDILSGFTIGVVTAYLAFRYYHLPLARGGGWAWAPRRRAWWGGVGREGWAGGWTQPRMAAPGQHEPTMMMTDDDRSENEAAVGVRQGPISDEEANGIKMGVLQTQTYLGASDGGSRHGQSLGRGPNYPSTTETDDRGDSGYLEPLSATQHAHRQQRSGSGSGSRLGSSRREPHGMLEPGGGRVGGGVGVAS